jgi:hypothetical protein
MPTTGTTRGARGRAGETGARAGRALAEALAGVLAGVLLAGCEPAGWTWVDDAPVTGTAPAPVAFPPETPRDTVPLDAAAEAALRTADLLREAGGRSLLDAPLAALLAAQPGAAAPLAAMAVVPPARGTPPATSPLGAEALPADAARCPRSLRVVAAPGRGRVAVWWRQGTAGRVALVAAWQDDTALVTAAPWRGPFLVDTLDQGPQDARAAERGAVGCARPAPGVALDDRHGWVHVAYALTGPEGSGVFYAHQMDPRAPFEVPQAVVYGDRLGTVRVAAAGDVVAVAYDDPNSGARPAVALAISRTGGHLFEERRLAGDGTGTAEDPHVAVRGRAVAVGWSERPAPGAPPVFRTRRALVRD